MTRAQADEVLQTGRARILEWVQRLKLQGGRGAVVQGSMVSLQPAIDQPRKAPPVESWQVYVFGTAQVNLNGDLFTVEELATTVARDAPGLVLNTFFWEQTQVFSTTTEEGQHLFRRVRLGLTARAIPQGETVAIDNGWRAPDFILVLEEINHINPGPVIRTHEIPIIGGESAVFPFEATEPGVGTELRPVTVRRI